MADVAQRVRSFIINDLGWEGSAEQLTDELPLIQGGALDSMGILSMVAFLESSYNIAIDDGEIVPANLNNLAQIERYVKQKIALRSAQDEAMR